MKYHDGKDRCSWANPKNQIYIDYHDKEWGVPVYDDHKLFEMLILESFQTGLSWECVLNKREAAVSNATIFMKIQEEYGTFSEYLWKFTDHKIIHEMGKTSSELSDQISKDLKKRGMKFVGTTIIYSYLQAVGVVESHEEGCFLHHKE